jgi:DNA polymerase-3 subunit alpha
MASVLTHSMGNIEKITFFMDECKRQGIPVLGPDVNESATEFGVNKEGKIRFGLGAVKGTGEAAVEAIITERETNGPFKDVFDLAKRANLRTVNKKTFESLAYAGGFDSFPNIHRAQYFHDEGGTLIEKIIKYGNSVQSEQGKVQVSLFGGSDGGGVPPPRILNCEPWSEIEKLKHEKDVVGFYISGHPLDMFKLEIQNFCTDTIDKIDNYRNRDMCVAGIVTKMIIRQAKNGNPFALFTVEDYTGPLDMALFGEDYVSLSKYITVGQFVYIKGKVQLRYGTNDQWELKPIQVQLLAELRKKLCKGLQINVDLAKVNEVIMSRFASAAQSQPGDCFVKMMLYDKDENMHVEASTRRMKIFPSNELLSQLDELEGVSYKLIW